MKILKENKYSILSIVSKYSFIVVVIFLLVMPIVFVGADVGIDAGIKNPLGKYDTLPAFIEALVRGVLIIGIPILVLAIIYAGFLYVKAQGNPGELEVAHRTLLYTVIGGALLLGAYVIANAIGETVKNIESGA